MPSRPTTGTLVKRADGYHVLIRLQGVKHFIALETPELDIARQRQPRAVRKFLAGQIQKPAKGGKLVTPAVTMSEVAAGVYETRKANGIKHWDNERRWWAKHCLALHDLSPKNVTAGLVEQALLDSKEAGLSRKSLQNILSEVTRILRAAKKQRLVSEVVADDVDVPRVERRKKKRVQLTNQEFFAYVLHPDTLDFSDAENARRIARGALPLISREVKTLAIVARCIGGARASDCHALTWDMVDLTENVIAIFRAKIAHRSDDAEDATDYYTIPEDVRPYLVQWWTDHGKPESGPVFPPTLAGHWKDGVRRYGTEAKKKKGYAGALRRDLMTAGVTRHEVQNETPKTKPTGVHDLRRGLVSAMRKQMIPTRMAMAIVHHTSKATHDRYDTAERDVMTMPANALPALPRPKLLTAGQMPDDQKSSHVDASTGESGQMSRDKCVRPQCPEPPVLLAATGTYNHSEFSEAVEAPGIEPGSARHPVSFRSRA